MQPFDFVTYELIEQRAIEYYQDTGRYISFPDAVNGLFASGRFFHALPRLPERITWCDLNDQEFYKTVRQIPIRRLSDHFVPHRRIAAGSAHAIYAESFMPEQLDVFCTVYLRYIRENLHTHNYFEMNYVMSGRGILKFENETRELAEGEICIIAPGSRHDVLIDDQSLVVSLMLRDDTFESTFFRLLVNENLVSSFFRSILYAHRTEANYMLFHTDNGPELKGCIKDIFMECHVPDPYSNTCVISRIHLLFALLLRRYDRNIQVYEISADNRSIGHFIQVLQYVQKNYATVSLTSLAEYFHYNPSYLSRLIKKNTGKTLLDILTSLKMSAASDLLLNTNMKIEEIGAEVGYPNTDHFSRQFKKIYGQSPRDYRNAYAQ